MRIGSTNKLQHYILERDTLAMQTQMLQNQYVQVNSEYQMNEAYCQSNPGDRRTLQLRNESLRRLRSLNSSIARNQRRLLTLNREIMQEQQRLGYQSMKASMPRRPRRRMYY